MYHFAYGSTLALCNADQVLYWDYRPCAARRDMMKPRLQICKRGFVFFAFGEAGAQRL